MLALRLQKSISIEIYFLSTLWMRIDAAVSLVYDYQPADEQVIVWWYHKDVSMIPRLNGCASKAVLLGRTQRTKAFHLLSYLFSVQYYFSSVISNRSRDQPQNYGLSVQRICPLPVSYISLDPSPFHVLGKLYERTNSIMATR